MRVTFLGTGTSVGVPRIGCSCPVCTSTDAHNRRLRCSLLLERNGRHVLVDTPPDLRTQLLRVGLRELDGVLFTHAHADHLHGLDDVRCFCLQRHRPLPCHGDADTLARIRTVFDYAFRNDNPSSVPQLDLRPVDGPFQVADMEVTPVPVRHGKLTILGFRLGNFAYMTDCSEIPPTSLPLLQDLDILVLDALRHRPHPTHFSLPEAVAAARALTPRRTLFTHIAHDLDHRQTNAGLPPGMELAYDGLTLELS